MSNGCWKWSVDYRYSKNEEYTIREITTIMPKAREFVQTEAGCEIETQPIPFFGTFPFKTIIRNPIGDTFLFLPPF